jgi:transposase
MFHRAAKTLRPVYEAIRKRTPTMDVVQADETGQPTLEPGSGSVRKAWMWTFVDAQAILFVYSFSRGGAVAKDVLQGSKGALVVDGLTSYGVVTTPDGRLRGGCWSHARRQIFLARKYATELVDGLLVDIGVLFLVEETAIDEGYWGTDRLLEQRAKVSAPALDRVFAKARDHVGSFSPKSTIAEALQYTLNQEAELRLFLTLRNLPIHNNASEWALRIIALLRKNALFVGHKEGGENLAVLLTLRATCQLQGVNPEAWLADVLVRIWVRGVSMDEQLPWNWVKGGVVVPELRTAT